MYRQGSRLISGLRGHTELYCTFFSGEVQKTAPLLVCCPGTISFGVPFLLPWKISLISDLSTPLLGTILCAISHAISCACNLTTGILGVLWNVLPLSARGLN